MNSCLYYGICHTCQDGINPAFIENRKLHYVVKMQKLFKNLPCYDNFLYFGSSFTNSTQFRISVKFQSERFLYNHILQILRTKTPLFFKLISSTSHLSSVHKLFTFAPLSVKKLISFRRPDASALFGWRPGIYWYYWLIPFPRIVYI